jgi:hypothetical protein
MFLFTNIHLEGNYICADCENIETHEKVKVRIHKTKDDFTISNGETKGSFVMALGQLRFDYKRGKVKKINMG